MLLGREDELAMADALFDAALAGTGGTLAIRGRWGTGKSALLAAIGAVAREREMRVLAEPELDVDPRAAWEAVASLAEAGPVVLLVDDAEPAEAASLAHVAARLDSLPVALVAVIGEPAPAAAAIDALLRAARPREIVLGPLTAGMIGQALHRASAGLPLLVAVGRGEVTVERAAAQLRSRLERVGPSAPRLVEACAIVGRPAGSGVLAELAGVAPSDAVEVLHDLVAAGILRRRDEGIEVVAPLLRALVLPRDAVERAALEGPAVAAGLLASTPTAELATRLKRAHAAMTAGRLAEARALERELWLEELADARPLEGRAALEHALALEHGETGDARAAHAREIDDVAGAREAVARLEAEGATLEAAWVRVRLGELLTAAGDRVEAREHLRDALDQAHRMGAKALEARARAGLVAAGARPRRAAATGAAALTKSERRIATLAASGLSNVEIAEQLFLAKRTVEMHMTNAMRKLGASSRHELAALLAADDD